MNIRPGDTALIHTSQSREHSFHEPVMPLINAAGKALSLFSETRDSSVSVPCAP
jgi:hypothetical protein